MKHYYQYYKYSKYLSNFTLGKVYEEIGKSEHKHLNLDPPGYLIKLNSSIQVSMHKNSLSGLCFKRYSSIGMLHWFKLKQIYGIL